MYTIVCVCVCVYLSQTMSFPASLETLWDIFQYTHTVQELQLELP